MSIEAEPPATVNGTGSEVLPSKQWTRVLEALYSESVLAKVWFVASKAMGSVSDTFFKPLYYLSVNPRMVIDKNRQNPQPYTPNTLAKTKLHTSTEPSTSGHPDSSQALYTFF